MRSIVPVVLILVLGSACGGEDPSERFGYLGAPPDVWAQRLASPDPVLRRRTIEQLGEVREDVVPLLTILALSPDPRLRAGFREVLATTLEHAENGNPARLVRFTGLYITLWNINGDEERRLAIRAFRFLGPRARPAVPVIAPCLSDRRPDVRLDAVDAILAVDPAYEGAIDAVAWTLGRDEHRERAVAVVEHVGPLAVPRLAVLAAGEDEDRRIGALTALGILGPRAVGAKPALVDLLEVEEEYERGRVAVILGRLQPGCPEAVGVLADLLRSSEDFRPNAAEALLAFGEQGVTELVICLDHETAAVRVWAAAALVTRKATNERAVGVLTDALGGTDEKVAGTAYEILSAECDRVAAAVPALLRLLREGDRDSKHDAISLLGRIGPEAKGALPALKPLLKSEDAEFRNAAELAISMIESD